MSDLRPHSIRSKKLILIFVAMLFPGLAGAQESPCREAAKPMQEEAKMAFQNGEYAKAEDASARAMKTFCACISALEEGVLQAAQIAAAAQWAAQWAEQFSKQAGGQEK